MSTEATTPTVQRRFMAQALDGAKIDHDARTVTITFSSEFPVARDGYNEILEHRRGAVLLDRAAAGLPLQLHHDPRRAVGIVRDITLDEKRRVLSGVASFWNGPEAAEVWADVAAGLRPWLSVAFEILKTRQEPDGTVIVEKWRPFEVSIVNQPADFTVGFMRAFSSEVAMTNPTTPAAQAATQAAPAATTPPQAATRAAPDRAAAAEHARAAEIARVGAAFANVADAPRLTERAIREGAAVETFRGWLLDAIGREGGQFNTNAGALGADWHDHGQRGGREPRFSVLRAAVAQVTGDWSQAGYEREVSREIAAREGRDARGFWVPLGALGRRDVLDTAAGAALVGTDTAHAAFVDALRPASVVLAMGATVIGPLRGNVSVPRLAASATAEWVGENTAPDQSSASFDSIPLTPHTCAATASYARKLMLSTPLWLEDIIIADLRKQLSRALDVAALGGNTDPNAPAGLLDAAGTLIGRQTENGAALSWADTAVHVSKIEAANAAGAKLGWVMRPELKASLMATPKASGAAEMIIDGENRCAGYPVAATNLLRGGFTRGTGTGLHAVVFGNWSDFLVGTWSGVDLVVDPYTLSSRGEVRISAFLDVDFGLRHPESFVISRDVIGQPLTLTGFVPT